MGTTEHASGHFSERLLAWFDQHGRKDLPWQQDPTPYRVWVSEVMLQQTQVRTVIPYYLRFMQRFPTLDRLAQAPLEQVLPLWAGLGYYARAHHLHKTAQIIAHQHQGQFPRELEALMSLPGIGRSTAGAILALSTQQVHPILDGNVKRILCRHEALAAPINTTQTQATLWALAQQYTPHQRVHHYTQAIMDFGATLCTRHKPRCLECPLQNSCQAHRLGTPTAFPVKAIKPKKPSQTRYFFILRNPRGEFLFYRRPNEGLWAGLWSVPESESDWPLTRDGAQWFREQWGVRLKSELMCLPPFAHTFSHYQLILEPLLADVVRTTKPKTPLPPLQWCKPEDAQALGLPAPIVTLVRD